jgi:multidrug efflux pump subunit AcrB
VQFYQALLRNHPLANISFLVVLVMGLSAYLSMPREQDPEINLNWLAIVAVLPGAGAEDVERKVTAPLEDAIARIPDIRFISSTSREGVANMLVRFRDIPPRLFDKRVTDLRREVQAATDRELPPEVGQPEIYEITTSSGFPTAMVLIRGRAFDETLRREARRIKAELERLAGVDRVFATGLADPELRVSFRPEALAARGLTAADLADAVARWFQDTPTGRVRVGDEEWLMRVRGQEVDADYLAGLTVFSPRGPERSVPLAEVAAVERAREKPTSLVSQAGAPAVLLALNKKSYTNTLALVGRIQAYIDAQNAVLADQGIELSLLDDQTLPTRQAIDVMQNNAAQGWVMVMLIAWLFLGSRMALLVGLGIPFALAGTFWILHAGGWTLNMSVLLGAIIALGMLVDDAVVILEDIYYRMARGAQALEAALQAVASVGLPVLAAVLTTMAAFLPLMLMSGIVGDFMRVVPLVVTLALALSLVQAFWMLPAHVALVSPNFARPSRLHGPRTRFLHALRLIYARWLLRALRHPIVSMLLILALFAGAIGAVAGGLVRLQFFAFDPLRLFYVNLDMPAGTAIDVTLREVERLERAIRPHLRAGELRGMAAYAGVKYTETEPLYGDAHGQVVVSLEAREADLRATDEIVAAIRRDLGTRAWAGEVTYTVLSGGPPPQPAIKVRLKGDDYDRLRAAADALKARIRDIPAVRAVTDDDLPGRRELILTVDRDAIRAAGLDPGLVARLVRLHVDGEIVAEARHQGDKVEVRVRASERRLDDVRQALDDPVALPGGGTTTLGALVETHVREARAAIRHYDLKRAITLEGDLDKTAMDTLTANRRIQALWAEMAAQYPGIDIDFSGELDDIQESLDAMGPLFLLGVGLIYLILAAQFRSYFQPLLILTTVPMAFTGVVFGLVVSGNPLSLYTLYGTVALTGIAVNAAIVLIDAANRRRAAGMGVLHATVYAARRRVVPILITSSTTIGGLFALALGLGGESLLWGPVAVAIVWGLAVSTLLTLFVVPLLYRFFMARGAASRAADTGA